MALHSDVKLLLPELVRDLQAHLIWLTETDASDLPRRAASASKATPARAMPAATTPAARAAPPVTQPTAVASPGPAAPSGASSSALAPTLQLIREEIGDCKRCRLHEGRTHIVFGVGNPKAEVCFVGEGPGADEDAQGEPFVGRAGQLLNKMIEAMGFQRQDVYICNVVKCRPPNNRAPEPDEMETCSPFLRAQLRAIQPKAIVVLGKTAVQALLNDRSPISRLRGRWREYEGIPLMPTFHPAYLLRSPGEKSKVWEDLKAVVKRLGRELPAR
jgi:uracil-DNA glycosylase family 4